MFVHLVLVVLCIWYTHVHTKILYTSNIAKDLLLGCGLFCVVLVVHLVLLTMVVDFLLGVGLSRLGLVP